MSTTPATVTDLRDGRYRILVEARRDPATGKRRYLSEVVQGTAQDAAEAAERLVMHPDSVYVFFGR